MRLELNPSLNIAAYSEIYARDGVVRIADVLAPASAEAITRMLEEHIPWQLILFEPDDPECGRYDATRVKALGESAINSRVAAVVERASREVAYMFLGYPMVESFLAGKDPGHPIHEVSRFLNGPDFLNLLRAVTRRDDVVKAYAFATHYRSTDFLNLHNDSGHDIESDNRICAYTLGFTRKWRPDWGGQLLFHDDKGEIIRGLAPMFNALTLFPVPCDHSVAPVATYATAPRLSIVGWGRGDLPPK